MKVLVLGASGFLGSKLYQQYKNLGYEVFGTYRSAKNQDDLLLLDMYNKNEVAKILDYLKPNVVIWSLMSKTEENVLTDNGLTHIIKLLPSTTTFVYISSDSVFMEGKGNYREDDLTTNVTGNNPLANYVNGKITGEKMLKDFSNHIIIRTGPIYGKDADGNWDHRTELLIKKLKVKETISRMVNLFKTFVHVDDLANGIIELVENNYRGIIHLGPDQKESYYSFSKKMAMKLGLDERYIVEDYLSDSEASAGNIPLDTSLNTDKAKSILKMNFRIP